MSGNYRKNTLPHKAYQSASLSTPNLHHPTGRFAKTQPFQLEAVQSALKTADAILVWSSHLAAIDSTRSQR